MPMPAMYTLSQVRGLNGQVGQLQGPDGNWYTPAEYALTFYGVSIPDMIPPGTPIDMTPPPTPTPPPSSAGATTPTSDTVYRLILPSPDGTVATGATLPGCSQANSAACDPQQLASVDAAIDYASNRGETPVLVRSTDEAWAIVNGQKTPDPSQIPQKSFFSSLFVWIAGFFLARKFLR